MGNSSFYGCSITEISLPDSIVEIGGYCFYQSLLRSINIPSSINIIRNLAFYLSRIQYIDLSGTKSSNLLEDYVFYVSDLENVALPISLKKIPLGTFLMTHLRNITIPENVEIIETRSFAGCNELTEIISKSRFFKVHNGILYSSDYKTLYIYPSSYTIDILPSVKILSGAKSFRGCTFSKFILNNSIKVFEMEIFRECYNVEYIDLSAAYATSLPHAMFYECRSLKTLILPDTITTIGDAAFSKSALQTIYIPPRTS